MSCPLCGFENKPGSSFCGACGSALAAQCPSCGEETEPAHRFCTKCGRALPVLGPSAAARAPAGPELRFVSVVFVDLVGFTTLSERREAEDVSELLARYSAVARTAVERHGGVVDKFIGDAVMAVWGTRGAREDDAERAVRAALEIVDAVAAFGAEVHAPGLTAHAGVVTGRVAAMASEATVVGDRVNAASRLQAIAPPDAVLVDEVTRQLASAAILFEDAGEHPLKGRAEPLRAWRAIRVVAGMGGRDREPLLQVPFVGREDELRIMKEALHGAVERRSARLVAIFGEAGVGKSRLRRELSRYVDGLADTFLWHQGRCLSHGDGVAYWALAEMVRQRLGIAEDAPGDVAQARLEAGLSEWVDDPEERAFISPRLGALLGVAHPGLDRAELFAGWRLFLERLAASEPVILVFEDMEWADEGLLEFVEHLLDWSARTPIFMLLLARPELAARRGGWPGGLRGTAVLHLERLADHHVRELLEDVVEGISRLTVERIVERARGVPLFAVETVRALADRGVLAHRDGRLVAEGELDDLEVPATLSALLVSRVDGLEESERELVRAMAVFGVTFSRPAALALSALPAPEADAALHGLVRKQVLEIRTDPLSPDRGQYAFTHGLLRSVTYDMVPRRERKQRHLAAAAYLQQAVTDDGDEVAELIATHYLKAYRAASNDVDAEDLRARTVDALRQAARRASTIGAPEVAQRAFEQAGELAEEPERAELIQAAGEMAVYAGRAEEAIRLLDRAAEAYARAGRARARARTAHPIARALIASGRIEEAADRLANALRLLSAQAPFDADVARLNALLGRVYKLAGDFDRATSAVEAALTIARALDLPDVLGEALVHKAGIHLFTGRPIEAEALYTAALEVAQRHGLDEVRGPALANLSNLRMLWDLPGAREQADEALVIYRRRGNRPHEIVLGGNLMTLHLYAGRWNELEDMASELLAQDSRRPGAESVHYRLLQLHTLRGELDAAAVSFDYLADWQDCADSEWRGMHDAATVMVRIAGGRAAEALDHAAQTLGPALETVGAASDAVRDGYPHALRAAFELARHDDARQLIGQLAERSADQVPPYLQAQLARGRALLAAAAEDHDAVERDLGRAITAFDTLGYRYWLAAARSDLAAWLIDQDRPGEARALLEQAIAALSALRAAPALARARTLSQAVSRDNLRMRPAEPDVLGHQAGPSRPD